MRSPWSDRRVFVDTSAYYAAIDRRDFDHDATAAVMRRLVEEQRPLVTTNAVLFEMHGLLLNRIDRRVAWNVLMSLRASQTVVRVRVRDESRAEEILDQYDDKEFSVTDALSFAVMERLDLRVAFSLDRHFAQFGWTLIPIEVE